MKINGFELLSAEYMTDTVVYSVPPKTFNQIVNRSNDYISLCKNIDYISTESISSIIKKMMIGLANLLKSIVNQFNSLFLDKRIELSKSELNIFCSNNKQNIRKVLSLDFTTISDIVIPIPQGMSNSYIETIRTVDLALTNLQMLSLSKRSLNTVKNVCMDIQNKKTTSSSFKQIGNITTDRVNAERQLKSVNNCFTGKPIDNMVFPCFRNIQDIEESYMTLLAGEKYLKEISIVHTELQELEQCANCIIEEMVRDDSEPIIEKKDMVLLADMIKNLAHTFDIYGNISVKLHVLEHNICEVFKVLFKI